MRFHTRAALALLAAISCAPLASAQATKPAYPFHVDVVGKGRPVILIPGLDCSGDVWHDVVAHLSADHECHVLTLGGFAGEPAFEGPFVETVRDGLVKYIADKKLKKPAIIGHSIGGYLGYVMGIDAPDSVGPIVCVDGVPCLAGLSNPEITADQLKPFGDRIEQQFAKITKEQFLAQQKTTLTAWITDEKQRARVAAWGAASDVPETGRAMAGVVRGDLRGDVAKIHSPLLLVAAAAPVDGIEPQTLRDRYEAQVKPIADHRTVYAEHSHHFVMFDEPDWLMKQIDTFLAAHP